jgi:transposase InsO family protein
MTWKVTDTVGQRIEFVVRVINGESVVGLCQEYEVSRQTGHLWLKRYREAGSFAALEDRSRVAKRIWNRTSGEVAEKVLQLRKEHGWAGRKIQKVLERDHGIAISARTIDRILDRNHCIDNRDRRRPAPKRFERDRPNELWQMDFKGQYRLDDATECYPLSILDDHSRFLVGLHALPSTKTVGVEERLIQTFQRYGLPDEMLMDHGVPWWKANTEIGLTKVSVMLMKQGIHVTHSGIGHPQTQGKVERFNRTLKAAMRTRGLPETFSQWQRRLSEFRRIYNQMRPHEAIEMEVPAQRYEPSQRRYQPRPAEWDYPAGYEVVQLNSQGSFHHGGPRFVSKALANEIVGYRTIDQKLLVCYRSTYVREIDLKTGRTIGIMIPIEG